jgi:hypothetical protein
MIDDLIIDKKTSSAMYMTHSIQIRIHLNDQNAPSPEWMKDCRFRMILFELCNIADGRDACIEL